MIVNVSQSFTIALVEDYTMCLIFFLLMAMTLLNQ